MAGKGRAMAIDEELDSFDEEEALDRVRDIINRGDLGLAARFIYNQTILDEPLLTAPEWADIWRRVKPTFARMSLASPGELRRLDDLFDSIQPTDPGVFDLRVANTDAVVFILGAGASVPVPSNLETVADLLPELWRRAGRLGREDLRALESWCKEQGISNIEDLLTAAYIANFASKNSQVLSLLDYFLYSREPARPGVRRRVQSDASALALLQETFQTLFGLLLGRMINAEPNPAHEAIVKLAEKTGKVGVITTNYDGASIRPSQTLGLIATISWANLMALMRGPQ